MLVVGAGGMALQIIDDLESQWENNLIFWSGNPVFETTISSRYTVLSNESAVRKLFEKNNQFILCIGNPANRERLLKQFQDLGGVADTFISPQATVSKYARIGEGSLILHGAIIEAGANIGIGVLINAGAIITHETILGNYSEIAPGASIGGKARIGNGCFVGLNASILPKIELGNNVIVGAGAVVTKNIMPNCTVAGVPAKRIK